MTRAQSRAPGRAAKRIQNKSKENQANPNKKAWISLDSFGRIGTFQWVTANPNKKKLFPYHTVAKISQPHLVSFSEQASSQGLELHSGREKAIAHISDFRKQFTILYA
jgi:hypothetical protein